jgi:KDO2-lipid IV(A) lauroyltransferase
MRDGTRAVISNLRGMFPDMSDGEARQLALRTYRNYARDTIHFMRSLSMGPEAIRARVSRLEARALEDAIGKKRGVISVSAHFGNWELGGVLLRRLTPHPLTVIVMREPDDEVTQLRTDLRASLEIDTIEVRNALETGLRVRNLVRSNRVVAMLVDRHVGKDRVPVRFFGRQALFLRTPALLAQSTGAPLVPAFVYRDDDDRFAIECGPAIDVSAEGDRNVQIARAMQQVADAVEQQIRRRPYYWYQFYPYWASQNG